jgi:hypothetical protein
VYYEWGNQYSWSGILETAESNDVSACVTASDFSVVTLSSYPQPAIASLSVDPSDVAKDPMGLLYSTTVFLGFAEEYADYFTDAAFQSCILPSATSNAQAELTARFITHSTKLFKNTGPTPSSSPQLQGQLPAQSTTTVAETPGLAPTPAVESPSPNPGPASNPEPVSSPEPPSSPVPAPGTESLNPVVQTPPPAGTETAGPIQSSVAISRPPFTPANPSSSWGFGNGTATVNGTSQPTIEISNDSEIIRAEWHNLWLPVLVCTTISLMV